LKEKPTEEEDDLAHGTVIIIVVIIAISIELEI
jgi:hypothetical protein